MYIELDGMTGIDACWLAFAEPRILPVLVDVRDRGAFSSAVCLVAVSGLKVGKGGGNGDIDMDVTLAECAWYTRRGFSSGNERTCCTRSVGHFW